MICQKCHIEYDEGKRFCRLCGSPLSAAKTSPRDGGDPSQVERIRMVRVCPRCHLHFEVGNYCRICGSFLKQHPILQERERFEGKEFVRRLFAQRFRLTEEKREFEICLGNLGGERDALPEDTFNLILQRYQAQVESISSRLREIDAEIESIRKKVSEKIGLLEEESKTIQKRFEEIRSLHQLGAITRTDYLTEKDGVEKEMKSVERRLKEYRTTIHLLSIPTGGESVSSSKAGDLFRYRFPLTAGGIIILIVLGAYFLLGKNAKIPHPQKPIPISQTNTSPPAQGPVNSPEVREDEKIKSLFGTIRQANIEKKIDLFMSCYAADFKDRNGKRLATLETWDHFDYLDLSYDLKRLTVTAQNAQVRVEWRINISPKNGGPPQKTIGLLDVTLKKEGSHWKIGEIKPVG
jgi:hypothetical protein